MIPCNELNQTKNYLLQQFKVCKSLNAEDMKLFVEYTASLALCIETGGSTNTYLSLLDTNNSYEGHAGKIPVVNEEEDALEFEELEWGDIGGDILDQTDLINYLSLLAPDGIISGGNVVWTGTGFEYIISATIIKLGGIVHPLIPQDTITLTASHPTLDRIDLPYVTPQGFGVITGVPAENPVVPQLTDFDNQLALPFILVQANTTEPVGIGTEDVYQENEEWATFATGSGAVDFDNTENPESGLKAIKVEFLTGAGTKLNYITFDNEAPFDYENKVLNFKLWLNLPYLSSQSSPLINYQPFSLFLLNENNFPVSNIVNVLVNPSLTGEWQNISYDLNNLTLTGIPTKIMLMARHQVNNTFLYIDNITLQSGIDQVTPVNEHNALPGLQGGKPELNQFYHLDLATYQNVLNVPLIPIPGLNIIKGQCNSNPEIIEKGDIVHDSLLNEEVFLLFGQYNEGDPMELSSYVYTDSIEVECAPENCEPKLFDPYFECFFE